MRPSVSEVNIGVRRNRPAMTARAARMSSSVTSRSSRRPTCSASPLVVPVVCVSSIRALLSPPRPNSTRPPHYAHVGLCRRLRPRLGALAGHDVRLRGRTDGETRQALDAAASPFVTLAWTQGGCYSVPAARPARREEDLFVANTFDEQAKERFRRSLAFMQKAHALLQDDLVYRSALADAVSAIKNMLQGYLLLRVSTMPASAVTQRWQEVAVTNRMPDLIQACIEAGLSLHGLERDIKRLNNERNYRTHDDPQRLVNPEQAAEAYELALTVQKRIKAAVQGKTGAESVGTSPAPARSGNSGRLAPVRAAMSGTLSTIRAA